MYNPYQYQTYQPMDQLAYLRQQQQPQSNLLYVQGVEAAKAYMVAAGNSVLLMDTESQTFYIKATDQSGMPMPIRVFDFTERNMQPQQPMATPITQEQYSDLIARIEALETKTRKVKEENDG